ncbi:MAG: hypothetical protein II539_06230 [Muribaculaceae bacterium]|nr:hypothetical protein [Muribaculaceae bacterium]
MRGKILSLILIIISAGVAYGQLPADSVLRRYAAQMLMVGFKGDSINDQSDAARYVRDLKVGAIVLFDVDLTGDATIGSRNVTSTGQLATLTRKLQSYADYPLLIALDQEGGRVVRMKTQYGFQPIVSAKYLGETDNEDTTRFYGHRMGEQLHSHGVNINLAPVLDLDNPQCPAIGKLDRSYGASPTQVVRHARWLIEEHHKQGVLCAVKHFPGHGSAISDSHWGFVDVTQTWSPTELIPFRRLIHDNLIDLVMTAHIFNQKLDPDYPATLSRKTLEGLLRKELGYDGVVVTDDMYMEGIINQYSIERALVLAINAGADLICVGNNINTGFEPDRPFRLVDIIVEAVKRGEIPYARLLQSHNRLERLYNRLASLQPKN